MKSMETVIWPKEVVDAARKGSLGFFVGNGVSRLSGAPSWASLFDGGRVRNALKALRVGTANVGFLELADALESKEPAEWDGVLAQLYGWSADAEPNQVHSALRLLKPAQADRHCVRMLTSNVDWLLERAGFTGIDFKYCHGEPHDQASWIFSTARYWKAYDAKELDRSFSALQADQLLFVGYGHSNEDFDIIQSVSRLRKKCAGACLRW